MFKLIDFGPGSPTWDEVWPTGQMPEEYPGPDFLYDGDHGNYTREDLEFLYAEQLAEQWGPEDWFARLIWETSRKDEGTISATGATHIAKVLVSYLPFCEGLED